MVTGPAVTTTLRSILFSVVVASLSAEKNTNIVRLCAFVKIFEKYLEKPISHF